MRRRCAGTLVRVALSNKTVSSSAMRPRSGVTRPAIMLTIEVLPAPEGPYSAVAPPSVSNRAAIAKSPRRFSTSTKSISVSVIAHAGAPREPLRRNQRRERDHDGDDDKAGRGGIAVRDLREGVDRSRQRLRLAGNVGDEGDGGAELAERLGEAQHHAGDDAGQCERQRDGEKDPRPAGAKRGGGVLQPAVDGLERQPDGAHEQRKSHYAAGERGSGPPE